MGFPGSSGVKSLPANEGDMGPIPGPRISPGVGSGNPLQYFWEYWEIFLGNPMDTGAWRATVHGVTKSRTRLSDRPPLLQPLFSVCEIPRVASANTGAYWSPLASGFPGSKPQQKYNSDTLGF